MHTCMHTCTCIQSCIHAYIIAHTCVCIHAYTHTYMHTYMHTYIQAYIHITHIHNINNTTITSHITPTHTLIVSINHYVNCALLKHIDCSITSPHNHGHTIHSHIYHHHNTLNPQPHHPEHQNFITMCNNTTQTTRNVPVHDSRENHMYTNNGLCMTIIVQLPCWQFTCACILNCCTVPHLYICMCVLHHMCATVHKCSCVYSWSTCMCAYCQRL